MRAARARGIVDLTKGGVMSTTTHEPTEATVEGRRRETRIVGREMWAGLAIAVIWLAVLFTAVYGPNILTTNAGASASTVPAVVVVALFAWPSTWAVAKHGFGRRGEGRG
jgi:hypothetical protein